MSGFLELKNLSCALIVVAHIGIKLKGVKVNVLVGDYKLSESSERVMLGTFSRYNIRRSKKERTKEVMTREIMSPVTQVRYRK
jgi:hypothetical protein